MIRRPINKRAEGEITRIGVAVIVMAMFAASIISFVAEVENNYDSGVDTDQFSSFNRIAELQENLTLASASNIEEGSGDFGGESDNVEALLRSGFKSFKLLFLVPSIMVDFTVDAFRLSGGGIITIPVEYQLGIAALITFIVSASLFAIIFKVKP